MEKNYIEIISIRNFNDQLQNTFYMARLGKPRLEDFAKMLLMYDFSSKEVFIEFRDDNIYEVYKFNKDKDRIIDGFLKLLNDQIKNEKWIIPKLDEYYIRYHNIQKLESEERDDARRALYREFDDDFEDIESSVRLVLKIEQKGAVFSKKYRRKKRVDNNG